ncbi:MAG: hypothetical protein HC881_13150 [Leptolyngbyaceae cyanobacterium SL_7_1]|nr:hypothetical protein [Leptolyngbyaceae cyanobacterium SL_7_1]
MTQHRVSDDPRFSPVKIETEPHYAEIPTRQGAFSFQCFDKLAELTLQRPTCVRLDLEELKCFEVVDRQFQQLGVIFSNAIALHPSNPAFPPRSGMIVLMGSPRNGWVEAIFPTPVQYVSGFVTSSQPTVLIAFDDNNQPIGRTETTAPNLTASRVPHTPNTKLSLATPNIHRILFQTVDGQLTLDDFCYSF